MNEFRVYGPPGCIAADTVINFRRGRRNYGRPMTVETAYYKFNGLPLPKHLGKGYPWHTAKGGHLDTMVPTLVDGVIKYHKVAAILHSGVKKLYRVTTKQGRTICATKDHPFKDVALRSNTCMELQHLCIGDTVMCRGSKAVTTKKKKINKNDRRIQYSIPHHPNAWAHYIGGYNYKRLSYSYMVYEADMNGLSIKEYIDILRHCPKEIKQLKCIPKGKAIHHKDGDPGNDELSNLEVVTKEIHDRQHGYDNVKNLPNPIPVMDTITAIEYVGRGDTFDISMEEPYHFFVAQDFIIHNTGKTTRLATRDIPRAVDKFGSDKVVVTSFSRAAAREISSKKSRDTGEAIAVNPDHVGTTHSLCFHALGMPELVVKHVDEWNESYPEYQISKNSLGGSEDSVKEMPGSKVGSQILIQTDVYRAKMMPEDSWDQTSKDFYKKWTDFKKSKMVMDFTDLIENTIKNKPYAPGQPEVIFVDEAQDFTKLQLSLVRSWGLSAKWIVLVGDDDQCLYSFTGCDPTELIHPPVPKEHKTVLSQSFRIPRSVHEKALEIIGRVEEREPKDYKPRNEDGDVRHIDCNYKEPGQVVQDAEYQASLGKSVMILTSCDYMLNTVKRTLREQALPFHNPYRMKRGDWNPLKSNKTGTSAKDLLLNFTDAGVDEKYWNVPQFVRWAKFIRTGENGLKRSVGKKAIKQLEEAVKEGVPGLHTTKDVLNSILNPVAAKNALERNVDWLYENLIGTRQGTFSYPKEIYQEHGRDMLNERPKIMIGTIHSVKGGEADVVYIFPDISMAAHRESRTRPGLDAIYRMFYVGVTRAKEELVIASPVIPKIKGLPSYAIKM